MKITHEWALASEYVIPVEGEPCECGASDCPDLAVGKPPAEAARINAARAKRARRAEKTRKRLAPGGVT